MISNRSYIVDCSNIFRNNSTDFFAQVWADGCFVVTFYCSTGLCCEIQPIKIPGTLNEWRGVLSRFVCFRLMRQTFESDLVLWVFVLSHATFTLLLNSCGNIPRSRRFFYSCAVDTLNPIRPMLSHSCSADGKTLRYILKKGLSFHCSWSTLHDTLLGMFFNCLLSSFHSTGHSLCHLLASPQGTCCCLHPGSCPHVRQLHWDLVLLGLGTQYSVSSSIPTGLWNFIFFLWL